MTITMLKSTGSQKVVGSNPISSTNNPYKANINSNHLSTSQDSHTQLDIPLHRLINMFSDTDARSVEA
jgi:hypothetical protein